jgi:transcriptional regulator NrdR family protein
MDGRGRRHVATNNFIQESLVMNPETEVYSLRIRKNVLQELRRLAHVRSLRMGEQVTAAALVRSAIDDLLRAAGPTMTENP